MAWTEELKQTAIDTYTNGNPTPENSTELIKQIAEDMEQSANGVRMVLVQAGVYVKKEAGAASATKPKSGGAAAGDKAPRVSKESQIAELRQLIEDKNVEVDEDVLSKLTGKTAAYFAKVIA